MAGDLYVIDADAHVVEGGSLLLEILNAFPDQVSIRSDGILGVLVEGRPYPDVSGPGAGCPADKGLSDAQDIDPGSLEGILANADADGIDEMVLYPSFGMCVPSIEDPELATGIARLYNSWVADRCASSGGRLHAAAVTPIGHVERALEVLAEAAELGLVAVVVPPALGNRNLDHPAFEPFFAALEEMDIAVGVHGAPGLHLPKIGVDRFHNYVQVHCVSFPFDQMIAMTAMVTGGLFDRHPRLKVAFLEAGAGWLAWFIERLSEHFEKRGGWIEGGWKRHPSEYVAEGNVLVTCEAEESMLPAVVEVLGSRCVMFASDYPHWDGSWPETTRRLRAHRERIGVDALSSIAAANARAFYNLPPRSVPVDADA